jgi:succinyl-CoA synthetase beta subunit
VVGKRANATASKADFKWYKSKLNTVAANILTAVSPEEAFIVADQMLGHRLTTKQTFSTGFLVEKLYVTRIAKYKDEMYLAMTIDRAKYRLAIIISKEGGVNIETLAKEQPEKLHNFWFNVSTGITSELVQEIHDTLKLPSSCLLNEPGQKSRQMSWRLRSMVWLKSISTATSGML